MGNPLHYSLELPNRCLQLIETLWPHVEDTREVNRPELGSLTTTFLMSMSMPIINLPIERIERQKDNLCQAYADDRHLSPELASAIDSVLGGHKFSSAPFYASGAWSFATSENRFNIAEPLPDDLAIELSSEAATLRAGQMPTSQWCNILRNAMAHGGIAYLDEFGRSAYDTPVKMYAFISGSYSDDKTLLTRLNVLRISEDNYRMFLRKWVDWLNNPTETRRRQGRQKSALTPRSPPARTLPGPRRTPA